MGRMGRLLLLLACAGIAAAQVIVQVTVSWSPAAGGQAANFIFQRSPGVNPQVYVPIATVPVPTACTGLTGANTCTVSYLDVASATNVLAVGSLYYYQVAAGNSFGESLPSNPTSLVITSMPPATTPVSPKMVGAIQIQ